MRIAIVDDIASEREILKAGITEQTARLSLDAVISCHASGTDFLAEARTEHFDLVFLDPPYRKHLEKDVLQALGESSLITESSLIVVEAALDTDFSWAESMGYTITKEKTYKTNKHVFLRLM